MHRRRQGLPTGGLWRSWRLEELLEILKDPEHPEYEERLEGVGGAFDPEAFESRIVNTACTRGAGAPKETRQEARSAPISAPQGLVIPWASAPARIDAASHIAKLVGWRPSFAKAGCSLSR